jgi:hypothetical protein
VPHVFVESTWLFAYLAPAHHQIPAAVELLERAKRGDFTLHMPAACIGEISSLIPQKCKPRNEANALRKFLSWSQSAGLVSDNEAGVVRSVLNKYESSIQQDIDDVNRKIHDLAGLERFNIFSLDDAMLNRATEPAIAGIAAKPYDHAIVAGILTLASRLWNSGERALSFCETDADLQPWDRYGNNKLPLQAVYEHAHVWVYGDLH